jgi:hypothetical protein
MLCRGLAQKPVKFGLRKFSVLSGGTVVVKLAHNHKVLGNGEKGVA